jgi:hypothetical protein
VYQPERVEKAGNEFKIIGSGQHFNPHIEITAAGWLPVLLKEQSNFSLGFNQVTSQRVIDGLLRIKKRGTAKDAVLRGLQLETSNSRTRVSRFPDAFNPAIDRYDRRSAARLFQCLWPAPDVSLAYARNLAASIRIAHEAADACWSVTMFPDALRLNVGQVEALTLSDTEARFLFHAPLSKQNALPGEIDIRNDPIYPAVPVPSGVCTIAADDLPSLPSTVRKAHNAYIRAAASFKSASPWRKSFSPAVLEYLEVVLRATLPRPSYFAQQAGPKVAPLPDELDASTPIREGAKYHVTVNAYERNPVARCRCIAHFGPTCMVCGFKFGVVYGALAEGFIHVHHVKPLSEIGQEYEIDPVADLRPVCPNCHAVIHLGGGCRSIEEVRQLLGVATATNHVLAPS